MNNSITEPMLVNLSISNVDNGIVKSNHTDVNSSAECTIKLIVAETPISLTVGFVSSIVAVAMLIRVNRHYPSRVLRLTILLSTNDLLSCGSFLLAIAINTFTCDMFRHNQLCNVLGLIGFVSFVTSLNIVVMMSVERFMQVHYPLLFMTKRPNVITISIAVIGLSIDLLLGTLPLFGVGRPYLYYNDNRFCAINMSGNGNHFQRIITLSIAVLNETRIMIIVICNISVSVVVKRKSKNIAGTWNSSHKRRMANANAFVRLSQVIAAVNVILTAPYGVLLMKDAIKNEYNLDSVEYMVATSMMFVTPIVNPFLYLLANKYCRRCLLDLLRCKSTNLKEMRKMSIQTSEAKLPSMTSRANSIASVFDTTNVTSSVHIKESIIPSSDSRE